MSTHSRVIVDLGPVCGDTLCAKAQALQLMGAFPFRPKETGGEYKDVYWDEEFPIPILDKYFPKGFEKAAGILTDSEGQMMWHYEIREVLYLMEHRVNYNH